MQIGKKVALMAAAAAGTMVVGGAGSASAHGLFPQDSGARQSNACETNIGPFTTVANLAPPGEVNPNPDCVNVTNSAAVSQSNDCDTTTGAITHGLVDLAPTGDINIGADCTNVAIAESVVKHDDHHKAKKDPKAKHHKAKDPKAKHHKAKHKAKVKVKVNHTKTKAKAKAKKDNCNH